MRAREFVINIPITITMGADGSVGVDTNQLPGRPVDELEDDPVMVSPLQQEIELKKAAVGKKSPVINKLTQNEIDTRDQDPETY